MDKREITAIYVGVDDKPVKVWSKEDGVLDYWLLGYVTALGITYHNWSEEVKKCTR